MASEGKDQTRRAKRLAVIGPVPPIRSGVARHTAAVASALAKRDGIDLRLWSFRRQYPRLLYPGEAERAPDTGPPDGFETGWTLDGVNPLTWRNTARAIRAWQPDLAILPAWTFFLSPALGTVARSLRRTGIPCATIVHNAFDHDGSGWKARLSLWQLAASDRFVTHNAAIADTLADHFPGTPTGIFPHPTFDDIPDPTGTLPREAALELLFFGLVRPYKGLDIAIEALARTPRTDIRLTIAGEFWQGLDDTRQQISRLGLTDRITLIPRYVSDSETAELFHRADAVVLPYRSVTASGVIPTAYRYGRPVICSNLPGLASVVRDGETGWLTPPGDIDALAATFTRLDRPATDTAGQHARRFSETLSWDRFADLLLTDRKDPAP